MRFYRDASAGEQQVRDYVAGWTHKRTLREVRHFLTTAYLMQDEDQDARGLVARLLDGGSHADLVDRMTEAIAFVLAHPQLEAWADALTTYHEALDWLAPGADRADD